MKRPRTSVESLAAIAVTVLFALTVGGILTAIGASL